MNSKKNHRRKTKKVKKVNYPKKKEKKFFSIEDGNPHINFPIDGERRDEDGQV